MAVLGVKTPHGRPAKPLNQYVWTAEELAPLYEQGLCASWDEVRLGPAPWLVDGEEIGETGYGREKRMAFCKKACAACPVSDLCLAQAWDSGMDFGVWGGVDLRGRVKFPENRPGAAALRKTGSYRGYRSDMVDPKPAREWPVSALLKGGLIRWAKHHGISLPRKGAACQAPDVHQAGESCRTCWNEGRKLNAEYVRENYGDIPFPLEVEVA